MTAKTPKIIPRVNLKITSRQNAITVNTDAIR